MISENINRVNKNGGNMVGSYVGPNFLESHQEPSKDHCREKMDEECGVGPSVSREMKRELNIIYVRMWQWGLQDFVGV